MVAGKRIHGPTERSSRALIPENPCTSTRRRSSLSAIIPGVYAVLVSTTRSMLARETGQYCFYITSPASHGDELPGAVEAGAVGALPVAAEASRQPAGTSKY